jgi:uncharacterized membrane protein YhhN
MPTWWPVPVLLVTVGALILVDERAPHNGPRNLRWVAVWKPLSTLLVILIAALAFTRPNVDATYSALVLAGLLLSLAGDVLLIFPSSRAFTFGLVAFLCAHLAYIAAFVHVQTAYALGSNRPAEVISAAVLALVAGAVFGLLRPTLGKMKAPVVLYMLVISVMVHRALATALVYPTASPFPMLIVAGALLFYASDAILAIDRFKLGGAMPRGHLLNLSTYYAGQLLIALSVSSLTL